MSTMFDQIGAVASKAVNGLLGSPIGKALDFTNNTGSSNPIGTIVQPVSRPPAPKLTTPNGDSIALKNGQPINPGLLTNANASTTPGVIHQTPATPVKSITTPDGTITTYHAPTQSSNVSSSNPLGLASPEIMPTPASNSNTYSPNTGQNPNGVNLPNPLPLPANGGAQTTNTGNQNPPASDYGATVGGLINASNLSPNQTAINAGLINKASGPTQEYLDATANANKYNEALKQSRINEAHGLTANSENPISLDSMTGRSLILQNQYGLEQGALGSAYNAATAQQGQANTQQSTQQSGLVSALGAANTQQAQQQSGLTSAAGFSQPVSQFGLLTNPMTGQPLNTNAFQGAVAQASQLVQNGADPAGSAVQALLSPFGFVGQLAFNQAQGVLGGSGYNPTAQSTAAQTNATQGAEYQQQATQLDTGLKQLKLLQPVATTFLSQSGINPYDTAVYNAPIDDYLKKLGNTGAIQQWNGMVNEINKFSSQVLSAGSGGIPTDISNAISNVDVSHLNASQLKGYLDTLDALGSNQLNVLQGQKGASYGGGYGYSGASAGTVGSVPVQGVNTTYGSGVDNPLGQLGTGLGTQSASWIKGQAQNLGPEVLSFIGGLFAR